MFGLFTTKEEKAKIFSIPQYTITDKGILSIDRLKSGAKIIGAGGVVNNVEKVEKLVKEGYFYVLNKKLVLYEDQSVMLGNNAVHAKSLHRNDILTTKDGFSEKINTIKRIKGSYYFFRLTVSGDHTYYINDILVHNASRYWVGGTADWNATAGTKWSTTSGGGGGSAVPTDSDDVFLDGNSGAVTVTLSGTQFIKSLTCTGFTGTFDQASALLLCYGSITLASGMTYSGTTSSIFYLLGSGAQTITSNGKAFPGQLRCQASGGTYTLQDSLSADGIQHQIGTFDANNFNVTLAYMNSSDTSQARTLTMGSGTWIINGVSNLITSDEKVWNVDITNLTLNQNTSTIKLTNSSNTNIIFAGGGDTYNNVWLARGTSTAINTFSGSNSFANFKDDGNVAHSIKFTDGTITTITSLIINGSFGNVITLTGTSTGGWTISDSTGTNTVDYCNISYSTATGGASWVATHSTDGGNNTGWSFGSIASYSPASLLFSIPSITASYLSTVYRAEFTPLSLLVSNPITQPRYVYEVESAYSPLSLLLSIPTRSAPYIYPAEAVYTPLSILLTIPNMATSHIAELTGNYSPLSFIVTNPAIHPRHLLGNVDAVYLAASLKFSLSAFSPKFRYVEPLNSNSFSKEGLQDNALSKEPLNY